MTQPKGWHSRGYLPHFDSPETVQFVTFRLVDSLPQARIEALRSMPDAALLVDRELGAGLGECRLRDVEVAALVQGSLLHFDGQRYRLLAWCTMPNHVHVVVEPMDGHTLSDIVKSWKSFTARQVNAHLGRTGTFWEADYFDRYMRNEDHLMRTIEYVENNPVKAGLVKEATEWPWSSASRPASSERGPPDPRHEP
ncbi:MAG TPA: transposase [Reyranella sp.]|jgi:REP element-mobilizing transposase RayT|nr:transposase [Reyranella sp.]